jgi:hypothetical protein
MRSLPLTLLAVATLLTPAAALAASPDGAPTTARYFEITGLVYGDQKIDASGKIAVIDGELTASVGCNSIGGPVSLDGDALTITGPTLTTEMACPGAYGDAEAGLIKVLGLGTFHITSGSWDAEGGRILTVELTVTGPPTSSGAPDEPSASGPIATILDPGPFVSCPPLPVDTGTTSVGGGPVSGGGSGSSSGSGGSGSTGSGTSGSTGTGTASPGTEVVPPDPGTITEPDATPGSEPAATPIDLPASSGSVDPAPPVPAPPVPAPDASFSLGQTEPDPIGGDPNVGKPPVDGVCYGSLGAGQVEAVGGVPKAADAQDLAARDTTSSAAPVLPALIALIALLIVGGGLSRRRHPTAE